VDVGQILHQVLFPKLDGVKNVGGYFMARCPAHEDHNPSLSIKPGKTQPVLLLCHAGCRTEDILDAIGLTWQDISLPEDEREERQSDGEWTPVGTASHVYDYHDEHGTLLFQVLRVPQPGGGKTFRQRAPDSSSKTGWRWKLDTPTEQVRRVLYRLPQLIAALEEGQTVWVCYADDTEVLTPNGWKLLSELPNDLPVAQYDAGRIEFVSPTARQVFDYTGPMVSIAADWSGLLVTPDHRVLCRWENSRPVTIKAAEVGKQRWLPVAGVRAGQGPGPSASEARLLAAWQADGVDARRGFRVGWNLKKPRKLERLRRLLVECGLEYREQIFDSTPGWTYVTVDRREAALLDRWLPGKAFDWHMLDWSLEARTALLDELGAWDGDYSGRKGVRFFTAERRCADVVSAIAATSGYGSILRVDDRAGRPEQAVQYVLNLVPRDWRTLGNLPVQEDYSGRVYCLTVPSGYLVTRRQGKVTICGNCEGEKDVHALVAQGVAATCNPGGAGKWLDEYTDQFVGAVVRIAVDCDKPGQAHARQVAASLAEIASSVTTVESRSHKDVAEHLAAGKSLDDLLITWSTDDVTGRLGGTERAPDLHEFLGMTDPPIEWVIPGLLEKGDRLVWTGFEGLGKSVCVRQYAIAAACGVHPFRNETFPPRRVLYIDCENSERQGRRHFRRLEYAARMKHHRVPDGQFFPIHRPVGIDLTRAEDAAWLLERVTAHQPDLLVIGPFYRLHGGESEEEKGARRVVAALDAARIKADCALIVEHHAPHSSGGNQRSVRPFGSSLLLRWPEMGMGIMQNSDDHPCRNVVVSPWRGNRDERDWPRALKWGEANDDWPWVVDENVRNNGDGP
jgi:hypothetical protein